MKKSIIFSDIDGCLIGEKSTCLSKIAKEVQHVSKSFLIILTTGKTAHELIQLNHHLHLPGPFIIENGQGILFKNTPPTLPYSRLCKALGTYALLPLGEKKPDIEILKKITLPNTLLTEMDLQYLTTITGLSIENAVHAKKRFFTEPIFIQHLPQNELKTLKKQLLNKNLHYIQTSRFLHVTKTSINKGRAIKFLLRSLFHDQVNKTYAIGDSLNDFSMFAQCENNYYIVNQEHARRPKDCHMILEKEFSGWLSIVSQL